MNSKVTYHQQVSYCGKPRCRKCREGTGHGPYWYSYQTVDGRTSRTYVGKHLPPEAQAAMGVVQEQPVHAVERDKSTIRIYVLGQYRLERRDPQDPLDWVTVTDSTWQHQRVRALLGCLVSVGGRKLGREQIMEALWPDLEMETAGSRLDRAVYSLRQLFEPSRSRLATSPLLLTEREMIVLAEHNQIWIDADAFEQLLSQAHTSKDPGEIEKLYKEAISLYGGDFLPEDRKNEWARTRRESLQRSWIGLLLDMADLYVERDALNSAIDPLDRLLSIDPTNEAAVQRLMKLLMQLGRRGEALRAYIRLQKVLQQEYHISPLPDTRNLYEELRSGGDKSGQDRSTQTTKGTPDNDRAGTTRDATSRGTPGEANEMAAIQIGRTHQTPMVGRELEIEALHTLVTTREHAARFRLAAQKRPNVSTLDPQRRPQSVLLLGDVGIGKTRLAEEVSRDAKKRGWAVAWSRVYAQEGSIPYRLWIEVLRKAIEQGAWQRQEVTKRSLAFQPLEALLPELHDLINPIVFPSSVPPEQEQLRLWEAAYELLVLVSDSTPLLIVLDDLQWSDNSSCELLAYLARRIYGLPIIIIGTCRESELTAKHPLRSMQTDLQRENALESLYLEPLSNEQISSLVSSVPHVPQPVVSMISDRAAGNPFFAEELARTVGSQPDKLEPLPANIEDILPDTITAVLDLRLARLTMPCQRLLSKAAVLGGSFEFNVICAMEASTPGSDEDMVLDLLEEALRSGMLTEEGTGTRITYHFWHPLLVSHLYEGLSAARRASQHRRAAEVLQRVNKGREGENAATITRHLVLGGGDTQVIAHYAELAGDHAYLLSSYPDAEENYRIALDHLDKTSEKWLNQAYILERLGECTRIQGKHDLAHPFYEQALEIRSKYFYHDSSINRLQEVRVQALLCCMIGLTWYDRGNLNRAKQYNERGEQILRDAGITFGSVWAHLQFRQGYILWREGNYNEARRIANESLETYSVQIGQEKGDIKDVSHLTFTERTIAGNPVDIGRIHVLIAGIEATGGRCSDVSPHLTKALAIFEQYNNTREIAIVSCNLGDLYLRTAEYLQAKSVLRSSLNLAERMGDTPIETFALSNLGLLDIRTGNLAEAEDEFNKVIKLVQPMKDPISSSMFHSVLATVQYEQGKLTDAIQTLLFALKTGRTMHVAPSIGLSLVALGGLRIAQLKNIEVDETMQQKVRTNLLRRAKKTLLHAIALDGIETETKTEARLALAHVLLQLGDAEQAKLQTEKAMEESQKFELTWLAASTQRTFGNVFAALGNIEMRNYHFEQALHISHRNGMHLEYARSLSQYGQILLRIHEKDDKNQRGLSYLHEARQKFENCGAELDLKSLEYFLDKYAQMRKI